jgi:hypothetical protein
LQAAPDGFRGCGAADVARKADADQNVLQEESTMKATVYAVLLASLVAAGASAATSKPRAFFIEPKNGATVKTTGADAKVHLKLGVENYKLAAVPDGEVKTARPGVGHFHIGVDTPCVASGKTIVKGTPSWVHFGKGDSEMDMQLTPGTHKLAVQFADDLHNAIKGMCTTITIKVAS